MALYSHIFTIAEENIKFDLTGKVGFGKVLARRF